MAQTKETKIEEFQGIPGWTLQMEELFEKQIEDYVAAVKSGPLARIIRAAIVNEGFRSELENDPTSVLKERGLEPKGESVVVVSEDKGVFPIIIPRVVIPGHLPNPKPDPAPNPDPFPGPGPEPQPDPSPIDVCDDDLSSGTVALFNDDFDVRGVRNDSGVKPSDNGTDGSQDITNASDGRDPTGDPDSRD